METSQREEKGENYVLLTGKYFDFNKHISSSFIRVLVSLYPYSSWMQKQMEVTHKQNLPNQL